MNNVKWYGVLLLLAILLLFVGITCCRPFVERIITIKPGMSAHQVAVLLKEEELIFSPYVFVLYTSVSGTSAKIRPGVYFLHSRMSFPAIISKLVSGDTYGIKITIPEGLTAQQIARMFAEKRLLLEREFLRLVREKDLEGFLFPATYSFVPGTDTETIITTMVEKSNHIFGPEFSRQSDSLQMTRREIITLASIIEREAKVDNEKPLISAVFHNRLDKGWLLESCATVQYVLGKQKTKLSRQDLKIRSPYNTYLHPGLPPGPICNPGAASIRAALYPAETDTMFFLSRGDGTHVFSRYYKEHLRIKKEVEGKPAYR